MLLAYTLAFKAEGSPFPKTAFAPEVRLNMSPSVWWKGLKHHDSSAFNDMIDFVSHLMLCPASSASLERIFSNFSFIQNKLRNRLGNVKVSKLVFVYRMLRFKRDKSFPPQAYDEDEWMELE